VDTTTVAPTDGQALVWDNAASQWEPGTISSFTEGSQVEYWFYDGNILDFDGIGNSESDPTGIFFKPDGTKMFLVGYNDDQLKEFSLSTPWDLTSYTLTNALNLTTSGPHDLYFSPDGTKFFWCDSNYRRVFKGEMSTAWDTSTATLYTANEDSYYEGSQPVAVHFKSDGTRMFVGVTSGDLVKEFDLSTAWDLSTVTATGNTYAIHDVNSNSQPHGISFSNNGEIMYVVDHIKNIQEFLLASPWSISGMTFSGYQATGNPDSSYTALYYNEDANYAFVVSNGNNWAMRFATASVQPGVDGTFASDMAYVRKLYGSSAAFNSASFSGAISTGNNSSLGGQTNMGSINATYLYAANGYFNVKGGTRQGILFAASHNSNNGVLLRPSADYLSGARKTLLFPSVDATIKTDADTYYIDRFGSDAKNEIAGATERVELYYTARADGEGEASFDWGNTAASGQTISRTIYYSDKAFADVDTASDWTQLTSFNGSGVTKSAAYTEAKNQLNNRTVGTLPFTIKVTHTGGATTDYLYYQLGTDGGQDSMVGAYSVNRRLNPNYTGNAIKVRNSSGVELDIGFSGDDIDESALQTHIGSGDATVSVIYDQSGNGNDAVQSNAANQPEIASAGVIHKQNNKIVVHFLNPDSDDTLEYWLDFTNPDVYLTTYTFVGRFKHSNGTSNQAYGTFTFPTYSTLRLESNGLYYRDDNYGFNSGVNLNGQLDDVAFSNTTANYLGSPIWQSANLFHVLTVSRDNGTMTSSAAYAIDGLGNARRTGLTYFAECVFYNNPLSSQIYSDINDNVNAYYSIY
jgi:hypothetical protein